MTSHLKIFVGADLGSPWSDRDGAWICGVYIGLFVRFTFWWNSEHSWAPQAQKTKIIKKVNSSHSFDRIELILPYGILQEKLKGIREIFFRNSSYFRKYDVTLENLCRGRSRLSVVGSRRGLDMWSIYSIGLVVRFAVWWDSDHWWAPQARKT